jgi:peptidoglycan hydrolase CwlO-like protein
MPCACVQVKDNHGMLNALEAAKRMLQEMPVLLQTVKEQQVASEAAATAATAEAAAAKQALEEARAEVRRGPSVQRLVGGCCCSQRPFWHA